MICDYYKCSSGLEPTILCPHCREAKYCSKKCLVDDEEYQHGYECGNDLDFTLRTLEDINQRVNNGRFGRAKLVQDSNTNKKFVLERISKTRICETNMKEVLTSHIELRKRLPSENFIQLCQVLRNKKNKFLLYEHYSENSLRDLIDSKMMTPTLIRRVFKRICKGILKLHSLGMIHKNLKTESIKIDSKFRPKLCNYDWDMNWTPDMNSKRDWDYMAPEYIKDIEPRYTLDSWNLGIILFEMIHRKGPFEISQMSKKRKLILSGEIEYGNIDYYAKDLLNQLLCLEPEDRFSIEEILEHPFCKNEELEVKKGTFFFIDKKGIGILKAVVVEVKENSCTVKYEGTSDSETFKLKRMQNLMIESKNLEERMKKKRKSGKPVINRFKSSDFKVETKQELVKCATLKTSKPDFLLHSQGTSQLESKENMIKKLLEKSSNIATNFYHFEEEDEDEHNEEDKNCNPPAKADNFYNQESYNETFSPRAKPQLNIDFCNVEKKSQALSTPRFGSQDAARIRNKKLDKIFYEYESSTPWAIQPQSTTQKPRNGFFARVGQFFGCS